MFLPKQKVKVIQAKAVLVTFDTQFITAIPAESPQLVGEVSDNFCG
jgi:hypothetical protein